MSAVDDAVDRLTRKTVLGLHAASCHARSIPQWDLPCDCFVRDEAKSIVQLVLAVVAGELLAPAVVGNIEPKRETYVISATLNVSLTVQAMDHAEANRIADAAKPEEWELHWTAPLVIESITPESQLDPALDGWR